MMKKLFVGLALATALFIGASALAEENDITISPGKEGLPSSSVAEEPGGGQDPRQLLRPDHPRRDFLGPVFQRRHLR